MLRNQNKNCSFVLKTQESQYFKYLDWASTGNCVSHLKTTEELALLCRNNNHAGQCPLLKIKNKNMKISFENKQEFLEQTIMR